MSDSIIQINNMNIKKIGIGLGSKNISRPNFLWVLLIDIKDDYISEIVNVSIKSNISAIILTNTTEGNRNNLVNKINKEEKGGLSGEPLQKISTNMIKKFYKELNGKIPIIGVGGVNSGKSAYEKILAGASLLQLYTSFVYRGPATAKNIKKELIEILKAEGINNIQEVVGKSI